MAKKMTLSAIMEVVKKILQDLPATFSAETELAAKFAAHRNAVRQVYEGLKALVTDDVQIATELSSDEWELFAKLIQQLTRGLTAPFPTCTPDVMADVRYSCARSIADIAYFSTCNQVAKSIIVTGAVNSGAVDAYVSTLLRSIGAPYKLVKATIYELIRVLANLNASSNAQQAKALNDRGVLDVMMEVVSCANGENVDRESRLLAGKVIYSCLSKTLSEPGCEVTQLPLATVAAIKRHVKDILDRVPDAPSVAASTKPLSMPATMPMTFTWIWLLPKPVLDELLDVRSSSLVLLFNRVLELVWPLNALIAANRTTTPSGNWGKKDAQPAGTTESAELLRSVAGKWLSNLTVRQTISSLLFILESGMADARLEEMMCGDHLPSSSSTDNGSRQGGVGSANRFDPCHQAALPARLVRFLAAGPLDKDVAISALDLLESMLSSIRAPKLVQDTLSSGLVQVLSNVDTDAAMETDVGISGLAAYVRLVGALLKRAASSPELLAQLRDSGVPLRVAGLALDPKTRRGIRLPALRVLADIIGEDVTMVEVVVTSLPEFCPWLHKLLITGGNVSGPKQARVTPAVEVKETTAAILTAVLSASMKSDKVWKTITPTELIPQLIQHFQTTTLPSEVLEKALDAVSQGLVQHREHTDDDALRRLAAACAPHLLPLLVTGQPALRDAVGKLLSVALEMNGHEPQATSDQDQTTGGGDTVIDDASAGAEAAGGSNAATVTDGPAPQQLEAAMAYGLNIICAAIQSHVAAMVSQPPIPHGAQSAAASAPSLNLPDAAALQQLTSILQDCTVLCDAALRVPASEPSPLRSHLACALAHAKPPLEQLVSALEAAGQPATGKTSHLLAAAWRLLAGLAAIPVLDADQLPEMQQWMPPALNRLASPAEQPPAAPTGTPQRRRGRPPGSGKRQLGLPASDTQLPAKQRRQVRPPEDAVKATEDSATLPEDDVNMSQASEAIEELPAPRRGRRPLGNGKKRNAKPAGKQELQPRRTQSSDNPANPPEWLGVLDEATLEADTNTADGVWSLLELRGGVRASTHEQDEATVQLAPAMQLVNTTSPTHDMVDDTALPPSEIDRMDWADKSPYLERQHHDGKPDAGVGGGSGWVSPSPIASAHGRTPGKNTSALGSDPPAHTKAAAAVATMGFAVGTSQPADVDADNGDRSGGGGASSGSGLVSIARFKRKCIELKAALAAKDEEVAALQAKVAQVQAAESALRVAAVKQVAHAGVPAVNHEGASHEGATAAMEAGERDGPATAGHRGGVTTGGSGRVGLVAERLKRRMTEYKEQAATAASALEAERQAAAQLRADNEALRAAVAEVKKAHALEVQRLHHENQHLSSSFENQTHKSEAERDRLLREIEEMRSAHAEEVRRLTKEKDESLQQADGVRVAAAEELGRLIAETVRLEQQQKDAWRKAEAAQVAQEAAVQAAQQQAAETATLRRELAAKTQELEHLHRELNILEDL